MMALSAGQFEPAAGRLAAAASLEVRLADRESEPAPHPSPRSLDRECGCEVIHVLNKSDLPSRKRDHPLGRRRLSVSALRGTGVKGLLATVRVRLGISKLKRRTGPVLLNDCQVRLVEAAIGVVSAGRERRPVLESMRRYLGSFQDREDDSRGIPPDS